MPRFIVIRCCAKAECRRSLGVSELSRVDWLGQKEPLPSPTSTFSPKACQGARISGKSAKATAIRISEAARTLLGPSRSESAPPAKPDTGPAAEVEATQSPALPREVPARLVRQVV